MGLLSWLSYLSLSHTCPCANCRRGDPGLGGGLPALFTAVKKSGEGNEFCQLPIGSMGIKSQGTHFPQGKYQLSEEKLPV